MKKFIALCISLVITLSAYQPTLADRLTPVQRVTTLGIMTGYDDGTFGEEDYLTRAQMAVILCNLNNVGVNATAETAYRDVDKDYWASGYINSVTGLGLMQGTGDGLFEPDESVTYNQAVVVFINQLGYGVTCKTNNDDIYASYTERAYSIGLLKEVAYNADEPITRGQLARIIDNALDINLVTLNGDGEYETESDYTLLDKYRGDGEELTGIVEETSDTYLVEDDDLRDFEVVIDGTKYNIGTTNARDYLGQYVHFFVGEEQNGGFVLRGIYPDECNEVLELSGTDTISVDNGSLSYYTDGDKKKTVSISGATIVYNGRLLYGSPKEYLLSRNATIKLINNDKDKAYECVFVDSYEIARISKNNTVNGTIYLQSTLQSGTRTIDYSDETLNYKYYNTSGEELDPETLNKKDSWLEIYASQDGALMRVIALDEPLGGYVEAIDDYDEGYVTINSQQYTLAGDYAGFYVTPSSLKINEYYEYTLDSTGKIIFAETKTEVDDGDGRSHYGYIYFVSSVSDSSPDEPIVLRLINGTTVKNYKENEKWYIQGNSRQEIVTYTVADKVVIDDVSYRKTKDVSEVLSKSNTYSTYGTSNVGNVIKFTLNSEDKINKIDIISAYGKYTSRKLNAEQRVLGGDDTPFGIDDDTIVFFVPKSGYDDDINCEMKFTTDSYKSAGYDLDDEMYTVKCVVFESPLSIHDNSDFADSERTAVVQAVTQAINEDGELVYRVSGYEQSDVFNRLTRSGVTDVTDVMEGLGRGDIIQFDTDYDGQINKVRKIFSAGTDNNFYHQGAGTATEIIYGVATSAIKHYLGVGSTEFINQLGISIEDDGSDEVVYQMPIKASTAPDIYVYYVDKKMVAPGDFDDIITTEETGMDYASRVILYSSNSDVKSILILK